MSELSFHTVETGVSTKGTVIWLHGLGDDGFGHEPIVEALRLPDELALRFILPHAPVLPVTVNGGMMMPAWYDIINTEIEREIDEDGVRRSADNIDELIQNEIDNGIPPEKILLAGFSQGGVVAMESYARSEWKLGGLICLSTYLGAWPEEIPTAEGRGDVFIGHGLQDPVVPFSLGMRAREYWEEWGFQVHFRQYKMQHSISPEEITDVREFIIHCFQDK